VYVLNGTLGDDIVLALEGDAAAEAFDTFGKSAGKLILKRGVQGVRIPKGGYLVICLK
jgi:hypothetical protein